MELICLGVGAGKSAVYDAETSSAFLIRAGNAPTAEGILLIDCGGGVANTCLRHARNIPRHIFVTHNHTDHACELPVILAVERTKPGGSRRVVVAEERVAEVLRERRLFETTPVGAFEADWVDLSVGRITALVHGLAIKAVGPCRHTELCFGFVLYRERRVGEDAEVAYEPLLGFTGDSGFSAPLMQELSEAPVLLADARAQGTPEHAGFAELDAWQKESGYDGRVIIYHYGSAGDAPTVEGLEVARPGESVARWDALVEEPTK